MQIPIRGNPYVKNYLFDFNFGSSWGSCAVTMTSVIGHLTNLDFERQMKSWLSCPPGQLFDAQVLENVYSVCVVLPPLCCWLWLT